LIERRAFVAGLAAGLAARPSAARPAIPRVGLLTDHVPLAAIFVQGLSDAAWDVGQDVLVLRRGAGTDHWRAAARELAALPVSVIVAGDHVAARAARDATDAIPIVAIDFVHDPIASGLVSSLARPRTVHCWIRNRRFVWIAWRKTPASQEGTGLSFRSTSKPQKATVLAFEMKLKDWRKALAQAFRYRYFC